MNQTKIPHQRRSTLLALLRLALLFIATCLLFVLATYQFTIDDLRLTIDESTISSPYSPMPFLGINVALEQYDAASRQATLERLREIGFGWVRQRLDWGKMEPAPAIYDWTTSDALMQDIHAANLIPVIVLDGSPAWARAPQDQFPTENPWAPPADPQHLARFATAFAHRYGHQLRFYQIWDEPNIAPHWGNRLIEPVGYAQLLQVTTQAIRVADPDAVIISAALAPTRDRGHTAIDEIYYLQRLYAAGAAPYFDILAIQPFGFGRAPDDPRADLERLNFARARLLRETMVAAGDGETPILAVRYGWNRQPSSPWATVTVTTQARFATDALTLAQQEWPWLTAMAWATDQPNLPPADPMWGFALSEPLADAFRQWHVATDLAQTPHSQPVDSTATGWVIEQQWLLYLVGIVLLGWRMVVVMGQLPWQLSGIHPRLRFWILYLALWGALIYIYYYAVWPPVILVCWLVATLLLRWQPQFGLWLAALLIPFYAQHKELTLGAFSFAVAPTHLLLLCLAVAMVGRGKPLLRLQGRARSAWRVFRRSESPVGAEREQRDKLAASPQAGRQPGGAVTAIKRLHALDAERPNGVPTPEREEPAILNLLAVRVGEGFIRLANPPFLALAWLSINLLTARNVWHWPAYGEGLWDLVLMPLLFFWLVSCLVTTSEERQRLVVALFLGGVLVALLGLHGWWQGRGTTVDGILRLVGPYFSPNQAAFYLERTLFVGVGLLYLLPRQRAWLFLACGAVFVALLLTASRGALLLGIPAGVAWWGWVWWQQTNLPNSLLRYINWQYLALFGILSTVFAVSLLWLMLGERLTNSATVLQRLLIWRSSLTLWSDSWWLGVGPGGFFWHYPAYLPLGALNEPNLHHPHNLWLEFATGWGVWGLLWLGMLLVVLGRVWWAIFPKQERWLIVGLLAATLAAMAHAQVDALAILPDLALWLWLVLSLAELQRVEEATDLSR